MRDLLFLSGNYFDEEIPKEKLYLLKYFSSPLQEAFLKYYFVFGDWKSFQDHTGFRCRPGPLRLLELKLQKLQSIYKTAKSSFDLDTVWKIENGKHKLSN